ncbi:hypothetical protein GGX14DRAFT_397026 [Mycena pura]|uniref:Uncharacterized protein n=1 Tax=Mycena pura TaxID=153505 RepID=A0AAD6VGT9_9AGAR|nr:hypothetical protein GGX14DRAFT_397026 [Mycena pura]
MAIMRFAHAIRTTMTLLLHIRSSSPHGAPIMRLAPETIGQPMTGDDGNPQTEQGNRTRRDDLVSVWRVEQIGRKVLHAETILRMTREHRNEKTTTCIFSTPGDVFREAIQTKAANGNQWHLYAIYQNSVNSGTVSWQMAIHSFVAEAIRVVFSFLCSLVIRRIVSAWRTSAIVHLGLPQGQRYQPSLKNLSGVALLVPKRENLRNRVKFVLLQQGENHRCESANLGTAPPIQDAVEDACSMMDATLNFWLIHYPPATGGYLLGHRSHGKLSGANRMIGAPWGLELRIWSRRVIVVRIACANRIMAILTAAQDLDPDHAHRGQVPWPVHRVQNEIHPDFTLGPKKNLGPGGKTVMKHAKIQTSASFALSTLAPQ